MTIVPILVGGFGNRLYQIANAFRLQEELKCDVKYYRIDSIDNDVRNFRNLVLKKSDFDDFGGHELLKKDNLPKNIYEIFPNLNFEQTPTRIENILSDKNLFFEHNINHITQDRDSVVMGYYFSYKFIKNQIEKIENSFNPIIDEYILKKYPELTSKRVLGIHFRLGIDSDNNPAIIVPLEFYNTILNNEINNFDEIYVVSDNIEKSKNFINNIDTKNKKITFIEKEPMYVDMLVLSKCTILIIAPSTLSAWSAYLNKYKNVYVPKIWTTHHWTQDIPQEWKLL
jgi:hypothetical protein